MSKVRYLEPFVLSLLAGGLAILGGYLATRQAFEGERNLRQDQRAADMRAAARVLDLELFSRLRLTINAFGIAPPRGDIKNESVRAEWNCVMLRLEDDLMDHGRRPAKCGSAPSVGATQPPDPGTRLKAISWSAGDRHLLASDIPGDRWFQITSAVDLWAMISDRHDSVGHLVNGVAKARQTAAGVVEAVKSLMAARIALAPHVGLDAA